MPRYICKLNGLYFEWSTVVDAPVTCGMTLAEFERYYRREYGEEGMRGLPERMVRVEEKGTSSQLHDGIDDLFSGNRAGVDEAEMSRDEIAAELRASRGAKGGGA